MADLSLGILIDIVDEDWMRDTLPEDGIFLLFLFCFILPFHSLHLSVFFWLSPPVNLVRGSVVTSSGSSPLLIAVAGNPSFECCFSYR
jgi:hypothetical protein